MTKSQYELDMEEISRVQFKTGFDRKTKNKIIEKLENKISEMSDLETDGIQTGYFRKKEIVDFDKN